MPWIFPRQKNKRKDGKDNATCINVKKIMINFLGISIFIFNLIHATMDWDSVCLFFILIWWIGKNSKHKYYVYPAIGRIKFFDFSNSISIYVECRHQTVRMHFYSSMKCDCLESFLFNKCQILSHTFNCQTLLCKKNLCEIQSIL